MELTLTKIIMLIIFGGFIGLLGSVMGIGGGVFIVPFLTLVFNIPIKYAIAVSLVSIIATSTSVASVNVEKELSNIRLATFLEIPMATGSILATFVMLKINPILLQILFGFVLFPVALTMYFKAIKEKKSKKIDKYISQGENLSMRYYDHSRGEFVYYSVKRKSLAFFLSFIGGAMSGLFGLGGGIVQVPVMNIVCGIPMKVAAATSNFMIGLSASASVLILFKNGYVIGELSVFMIVGVIIGGFIGMRFLSSTKNYVLQMLYSFLLAIIGMKMIWSVIK